MSDLAGSHALGGMVVHLLLASTNATLVKAVGAKWTATILFFDKKIGKSFFVASVVVKTVGVEETHKVGGV